MSTQTPLDSKPLFDSAQDQINKAIASLGLDNSNYIDPAKLGDPTKQISTSDVFKGYGAGIEEAALTIATLMADAKYENNRLKAAELALRVHGIFKDLEDKGNKIPQVNITINQLSVGGESKSLLNLVMPEI